MKRIFTILAVFFLPIIAFGDVLPEPEILDIDEILTPDDIELVNDEDDVVIPSELENTLSINNTDKDTTEQEFIEKPDGDTNIEDDDFDQLGSLYFGFCNEGLDNLLLSLNAGLQQQEPFKICALRNNVSDKDIYINVGIEGSELDGNGDTTCAIGSDFDKFVTSGELGELVIPAKNYVIKEIEITLPIGYDGEQLSCLTYNVINKDNEGNENAGISVVIQKAFAMHLFVGSVDIKNEFTVNKLTTDFDDNGDLVLSFFVENIGNMENTFNIEGTIKGFFGYNKNFEITDGQVAPGKSQYVEINLGSLPSYGGKFDIDFTINGTPYFSYDITNANIDPTWLEPKSWDFRTSVFKMPWLILAVVVIFIILLIVLFKKPKQKVVYVQQQPQQPVQPQQVSQQPAQQYTQPVQQPVQQPAQPVQQPQQPQNPNYPQN